MIVTPQLSCRSLQLLEGHKGPFPDPSLFHAEQCWPFFVGEVLKPSGHLCDLLLDLLQQVHVLFVLGPRAEYITTDGSLMTVQCSLALLVMLLLMRPRIQLAFRTTSTHHWPLFSFSSTSTSKSFSSQWILCPAYTLPVNITEVETMEET